MAVNTPHVYARDLDARAAAGQITTEAALADPQRESLTSFLGLQAIPHVDRSVRPLPVDSGADIVLASDGLFKTLSPAEMAQSMAGTLQQRCDALVRAVVERRADHQDNVTVVALAARAEVPLAATIRVAESAAAPRRARWPWALAAVLATICIGALAASSYLYCCIPPIEMPKPPAAPKEEKKK